MIPDSDRDRVLRSTDLLKLAAQYVKLRRAGKEWFGLCPFHRERTPSFSVNPEKQKYLCRSCGAAGNAISFVMKMEQLRFPDAVRLLADRAGITIGAPSNPHLDAYVAQVKAECRWFWGEARKKYARRQACMVDLRNAVAGMWRKSGADYWWLRHGHYALSARRWNRIITRIDYASPGDLLKRYMGIRKRHPEVVREYQQAMQLDAAIEGLGSQVKDISEEQLAGVIEIMGLTCGADRD